jgi:tetratricopeptide (TPR) repeat protein
VYGQLTAVRRSRLHARVGLAIERLYGDQQGERLAELAHHFDQAVPAGEGERAFHYTLAAADDAQRRLAHGQAEAQLRRCLALVRRLTMVDRDQRELDVQLRLSLLLTMTVGYAAPEVADASERARQLCQRLGDREQMVPTMLRLWAFACVRADFIAADRIAAELLSAAGGDSRVLLGGHWATGVSAWHQGRLTEAAEHLGQAHLLGTSVDGESLSEVYTHHPSVVPAAFMAAVQWLIGERDAALATAETAVSTARQLGQPFSTVPALFFRSMVAAFEGDARTAAQVAAEAWDISSAGGFRLYMAMSRIMRGWAASQQGEAASGAGDIEQGLAEMEATGARMLRHFFLALLAEAYVAAGRTGDAVGAVDEALAAAEESGECFYLAELHRMRAVLLRCVTPPQPEEAAEELRRAAAIAEAQGALGLRRTVSEALVADTGDVPVPVVDSADPGCADGKPVGERTGTAEETLAAARRCLAEGDVLAAIALLDRGLLMLGDPELRLLRGQLAYYEAEWVVGRHHLEEAVRIFQQDGRPRRAALAASWVARVYLEGLDSPIAAKAWSARASRLLQGEGLCREAGWVAVNVLGCLVTDPDELDRRARLALDVARQLGDVDLEGKALADAGLAMVSTGQVRQGLEWLDEAMAMVTAGQVDMGIGAQMTCSFLTACERAGDLDRASAWLDILDRRSGPLATHCRLVCGALLCAVGRWDEGEAMLQETLQTGDLARPYHRVTARAALADLRIRQGDLVEAERLLRGLADHAEAAGPIARLHLARGEFLPAVAAARRGLRALGTDRLRAAPLYAAVAEAELSLGHLAAAEDAAAQAMELAEKVEVPSVGAVAALAAARVKAVTGPTEAATAVLHEALRRLSSHELPATRIALHLELARLYADTDKEAALAQARAALELGEGRTITLDRAASTLLCRLGVGNPTEVPASVRT